MAAWLIFLLAVLWAAALMFTAVFFVIMFSDLETDYINPIDFCNKMNKFLIPEAGAHVTLAVIFLLCGEWTAFLWNLPLLAYNGNKFFKQSHLYDATEIFRTMGPQKNEVFFKLGFYLLSFFYYLYRMILALIAEEAQ